MLHHKIIGDRLLGFSPGRVPLILWQRWWRFALFGLAARAKYALQPVGGRPLAIVTWRIAKLIRVQDALLYELRNSILIVVQELERPVRHVLAREHQRSFEELFVIDDLCAPGWTCKA